jgi:hypothetical protein
VARVVDACRLHHTTLTGLVQALILIFLTSVLKDMNGFASRTPYDLRHVLPSNTQKYPWLQPKESVCNYVSVIDHKFDADLVAMIQSRMQTHSIETSFSTEIMEIFRSVSARVRQEIQARLDSGIQNDLIGIMKFVSDWRTRQQSEVCKIRYLSWLVTNLGVLDGQANTEQRKEEGWSLRRAESVLSAEVPSAVLSVSMVTVKDEKLCITCSWQDCVVDSAVGEHMMSDIERWLNAIGS